MALAFTIAGLQTQLDAVATAVDGNDYPSAYASLAKAQLILAGIPEEVASEGTMVKMRKTLAELQASLASAQSLNAAADPRRLIRTGTSFRGRRGDPCCGE